MSSRIDELHPPKTYLYNAGDECIALTGGWILYSYDANYAGYHQINNSTKGSNCLNVSVSNGESGAGTNGFITNAVVNFDLYESIVVDARGCTDDILIGISPTSKPKQTNNGPSPFVFWKSLNDSGKFDITTICGYYYVFVGVSTWKNARTIFGTILDIYLL